MSTRSNIHFNHGKRIDANIYRHSDGYPGKVKGGETVEFGVLSDILEFYDKLLAEVPDNRMRQAEYLAAKFLVWQADKNALCETYGKDDAGNWDYDESRKHPLQFLGVAPCMEDHGDIEFLYELDCDDLDAKGCPAVRWQPYGGKFRKVYLHGKPAKAEKTKPRTHKGRNGATVTVSEIG